MPRNVVVAAHLPAPPERLFDMYLDEDVHAAITDAAARIDARPGGTFSALDGILTGTILDVMPKRLIVQSWRGVSQGWEKFYWTPWREYLEKETS